MIEVALPQPGGCYCGAVRFELTALPYFSYLCHCSVCRRRTGAAYGISTPVPTGSVRFTAGDPVFAERVSPAGVKRVLAQCGACGGKIYSAWEGVPYLTFRPGLLDDSSWVVPVGQIWTRNALPWAVLSGVASFEGDPDGVKQFADAWAALDIRAVERPPTAA